MYLTEQATIEPTPPSKTYHIIWNLLLADKQLTLTPELIKEEKIAYVVAILPTIDDYNKLAKAIPDVPHTVLAYGEKHTEEPDREAFDGASQIIATIAKRSSYRNVLVFCNNGYQRSLPFLVYYLTKFHTDEVPTIEKAVSIILSQIDKVNYTSLLEQTIAAVTKLF